jgi:tRNA threonylcarbamoyladenosine biosynthesis protein TsaE
MKERSAMLTESGLIAWGERIGREAEPPLFLALSGDLGAGKSTLARAVARGAGVEGPVPSPTFNLLFRYNTPRGIELSHLDLFRLEDPAEVWELGWGDLPDSNEIVLVEWPERASTVLPIPRWEVELAEVGDAAVRRVTATPVGSPADLPAMVDGR